MSQGAEPPKPITFHRQHFDALRQSGQLAEMKRSLFELVAKLNDSIHPLYNKEQHLELLELALEIAKELQMIPARQVAPIPLDDLRDEQE